MALFLTFLAWYGITKIVELFWKKEEFFSLKREVFQLFSCLLILLIWILLAQFLVFSKGPIQSEVGLEKVESIWKMIFLTTFGYGLASKQFLSGSQRGSFLIYDNTHIWPTETLLFIPFLIGLFFTSKKLLENLKKKDIESFRINSFLLISAILPLGYIFLLGLISARFHFLYFVPFVIISALGLEKIFDLGKENRKIGILLFLIFGSFISYASSWESWYYKVFNWEKFYTFFVLSVILTFLYTLILNVFRNFETIKNSFDFFYFVFYSVSQFNQRPFNLGQKC